MKYNNYDHYIHDHHYHSAGLKIWPDPVSYIIMVMVMEV